MADLFDTVLHALEGEERGTFCPDIWIERVHVRGRMSAIECLALVLFAVREDFDREVERHIVDRWADELRKAASTGEIQARDPRSLLPLDAPPAGWDWFVSLDDADKFVTTRGMGWTCSEQAAHIYAQSPLAPALLPPATATPTIPEKAADRQDRRLRACEAAGLVMPQAPCGRMPNGIGRVALVEKVSRQALTEDLRAALERRDAKNREGVSSTASNS